MTPVRHSRMAPESMEHPSFRSQLRFPDVREIDTFPQVVDKLYKFIYEAIDGPHSIEQLRTTSAGRPLKLLVTYLLERIYHPAIVAALLVAKGHFSSTSPDEHGVNESRAAACEIAARRFLARLSKSDVVDYLLSEAVLPDPEAEGTSDTEQQDLQSPNLQRSEEERQRLLDPPPKSPFRKQHRRVASSILGFRGIDNGPVIDEQYSLQFIGLNALEVAALVDAKKFLCHEVVQAIINGIWRGDIIFWESLSVHSRKKAQFYKKEHADPFCRLRVPRYQKYYEVLFFALFLFLYYAVVVQRDYDRITPIETLLYIWVAAFAYDEFSEFRDAGRYFYAADFWSVWDLGIIAIGLCFFVTRVIGITQKSTNIVDTSFDILSLEALFLVPRICSLLSIYPYFGTLIPCLKEMTKDFVKFLSIIIILYLGFLTTFTLLGRDYFTLGQMSWLLVKVFFGSTNVGFEQMYQISPVLGPPLMVVFVCMTNVLLITSLISLLSNSLTRVMDHAREEYIFIYSVFVLEASTSNRLTYFYPPLNLIPLIFLRPLRLVLGADQVRRARILALKATHLGYVAAILAFEKCFDRADGSSSESMLLSRGGLSAFHDTNAANNRGSAIRGEASHGGGRDFAPEHADSANMAHPGRAEPNGTEAMTTRSSASLDKDDLVQIAANLTAQVAELRAMVVSLQQSQSGRGV